MPIPTTAIVTSVMDAEFAGVMTISCVFAVGESRLNGLQDKTLTDPLVSCQNVLPDHLYAYYQMPQSA